MAKVNVQKRATSKPFRISRECIVIFHDHVWLKNIWTGDKYKINVGYGSLLYRTAFKPNQFFSLKQIYAYLFPFFLFLLYYRSYHRYNKRCCWSSTPKFFLQVFSKWSNGLSWFCVKSLTSNRCCILILASLKLYILVGCLTVFIWPKFCSSHIGF